MRIAVISDIHGNADALEAVLADLPEIDQLVCLGDLVGYYDRPNEVCDQIRATGAYCIRGNHDAYTIGQVDRLDERDRHYRTSWTREILREDNRAWLANLPPALEFCWDGTVVEARHASPFDEKTYVYPDFPDTERLFAAVKQVLLLGHTHHAMRLEREGKMVLNPGSVGQPRDWDPRAAYMILDTVLLSTEFRRVDYDHAALARRLRDLEWAESAVEILVRTKPAST